VSFHYSLLALERLIIRHISCSQGSESSTLRRPLMLIRMYPPPPDPFSLRWGYLPLNHQSRFRLPSAKDPLQCVSTPLVLRHENVSFGIFGSTYMTSPSQRNKMIIVQLGKRGTLTYLASSSISPAEHGIASSSADSSPAPRLPHPHRPNRSTSPSLPPAIALEQHSQLHQPCGPVLASRR